MKDEITEGRLLMHQHGTNWRLRNMENHPIDPNWETGTYSRCLVDFRSNKSLQPGTIVFDLVIYDKKVVIRSAFIITRIQNGTLYFESFYFADDKPLIISQNLFSPKQLRTRYGNKVSSKDALELLQKMKGNSYNEYKIGMKPDSIEKKDWKKMIMTSSETRHKKHSCYYQLKFANDLSIME